MLARPTGVESVRWTAMATRQTVWQTVACVGRTVVVTPFKCVNVNVKNGVRKALRLAPWTVPTLGVVVHRRQRRPTPPQILPLTPPAIQHPTRHPSRPRSRRPHRLPRHSRRYPRRHRSRRPHPSPAQPCPCPRRRRAMRRPSAPPTNRCTARPTHRTSQLTLSTLPTCRTSRLGSTQTPVRLATWLSRRSSTTRCVGLPSSAGLPAWTRYHTRRHCRLTHSSVHSAWR
mmetsp:Transcript_11621/g.36890  ORF Transcript_11621/g.36890 Transcript_11621/m.36890 type:complete len:229 (+) Transcript_11621:145-831(+)